MLCRVPAAKAGRDSIELEVFGMAGVPEGAVPGALPLDGGFCFLNPQERVAAYH